MDSYTEITKLRNTRNKTFEEALIDKKNEFKNEKDFEEWINNEDYNDQILLHHTDINEDKILIKYGAITNIFVYSSLSPFHKVKTYEHFKVLLTGMHSNELRLSEIKNIFDIGLIKYYTKNIDDPVECKKICSYLIKEKHLDINEKNDYGNALYRAHPNNFKFLIENGVDINYKDKYARTPLIEQCGSCLFWESSEENRNLLADYSDLHQEIYGKSVFTIICDILKTHLISGYYDDYGNEINKFQNHINYLHELTNSKSKSAMKR